MKKVFLLAAVVLTFAACGNKAQPTDPTSSTTTTLPAKHTPAPEAVVGLTEADFKAHIVDAKGTPVTWENAAKEIIFFRTDGTLGGQGDGGEETMYEGTWKVEGGKLVLTADKNGGAQEVKFEGDKMIMAGVEYHIAAF